MSTSPEDIDALFDAPAPASPVRLASPLPGAAPSESRNEQRVKVSWPARVQLPDGRVLDLRVRDLSTSGVGLLTPSHIPPASVLNFAMGVPALDAPATITPVTGTLRTTYVVVRGHYLFCGGTWVQLRADGRELIDRWIRKLRK